MNLSVLERIKSIALTPDDRFVILGLYGPILILDLNTKQIFHEFEKAHQGNNSLSINAQFPKGPVRCLAMTPDGGFIISGSSDCTIKIFELEAREEVHHFQRIHGGIEKGFSFEIKFSIRWYFFNGCEWRWKVFGYRR